MRECRIGYLSTAYHTSLVLIATGWFEKDTGLKTDWKLYATGPDIVQAFIEKKIDLGFLGVPPAMIGTDRGLEIKCVSGGHVEGTVVIGGKNLKNLKELGSLRETFSQFSGHAIGTPAKGSIHDVIVRTLLHEIGMDSKVSVKNFEWADLILEALEDHEVLGAAGTPSLAVLGDRIIGAKIILPSDSLWPFNPSYGIFATKSLIEKHHEILEQFLGSHESACNLIRNRPHEAAALLARTIGLVQKDYVLRVLRISPKYCASLSREYIDSSLKFIPAMQEMGYISNMLSETDVFFKKLIDEIHDDKPHYDDPGAL